MTNTYKFTLPSGVEAEVSELKGKHQRLLTQQLKGETHMDKLNKVLEDILVRIGSVTMINTAFIEQMLAIDRRYALVMARQFAMDFEPNFNYLYKWNDDEEMPQETEMTIDLKGAGENAFPMIPMPEQYKEYSEIDRIKTVKLSKGLVVQFELLDQRGERMAAFTKKAQLSSHLPIMMRRAAYISENGTPVQLNCDELGLKDLDTLRKEIKRCEGSFDTEVRFLHPNAENLPDDKKYVVIDLLGTINFFFPSGTV
jgi:hypothetical protein